MRRSTAMSSLAIPVTEANFTFGPDEAVLFGIVYGLCIGRNHAELADALSEVGIEILCEASGVAPTDKNRAEFHDHMNDIIEIMSVTLVDD